MENTPTCKQNDSNGSKNKLVVDIISHRDLGKRILVQKKPFTEGKSGFSHKRGQRGPKRHLVGPEDPAEEDHGKGVEGHKGRVDGPFPLDYASVQNDKARYTLHAHHGRRRQLPCIVSFVHPFR